MYGACPIQGSYPGAKSPAVIAVISEVGSLRVADGQITTAVS